MSVAKSFDMRQGRQTGSHRRQAFPTPPVRAYATHIGRVGALAVALGVGAGVAGFAGTAWADDTAGETTNSDSGQNSGSAGVTDTMVGPAGQTAADPAGSNSALAKLNRSGRHLGRVIVGSSGSGLAAANQSGAATPARKPDSPPALKPDSTSAEADSEPALKPDSTPLLEVVGQQPPSEPSVGAPIELPATAAPLDTPARERLLRINTPGLGASEKAGTAASPEQSRQQPSQIAGEISTPVQRAVDDATAAIADTDLSTTAVANVSAAARQGVISSDPQLVDTTALTTHPAAQIMDAPPVNPITQVVSGLLTFFGLRPLASTPVAPAVPSLTLLDVLQLAWREIERTFFNQTPTLAYNPLQNSLLADGTIEGNLHPYDPDSATLTYTATDPAHGSVMVSPDGTFAYTPDAGYTGPDSFALTVSDAASGFHIHGLSGLLNLVTFGLLGDSGHTYTEHITVNQPGLPAGFERTVLVSGLHNPMDFGFLPDGRILIAEKAGAIQVYNDNTGQLQSQPLITLPMRFEVGRGLLGIAVDPQFNENHYIYVNYVTTDEFERLSRLTVTDPSAAVLTVDPASEEVLLQGNQPAADDHFGGALRFGPDGKLYWAVGNNDFSLTNYQISNNAQDLSNIYGKILRINPDGTVPADNPFVWLPGANPYIYAYGFRNPFRMTFTPDGKLLVADVGEDTWEELNFVTAGRNYGWPSAEGGSGIFSLVGFADPIYAYPHDTGLSSITAVLVYQDKVFIADFNQGWIKEISCASDYSSCDCTQGFDYQAGATVSLAQGPDGNIYQLTYSAAGSSPYAGIGDLSRIAFQQVPTG